MPKPSPNKRNDNAKRARQNSPREEQQHGQEDVLYLELFDIIRTLQAKDETKEEQLRILQTQLDQALAQIKSLHTIVDRDSTWRQRFNLNESSIKTAEDLPQNVREIRRKVLVPALKKARKMEGTKATIIGDRLLVNGKSYSFDKIPKKWQEVSPDEEMLTGAIYDEEPEQTSASQVND